MTGAASGIETDVVVVGGGPAGLAAALTARQLGPRVTCIDEAPLLGGQIWRHRSSAARSRAANRLIRPLERSGTTLLASASVVAVTRGHDGVFELLVERDNGAIVVRATSVVLATGARELLLPFPGWTLPGVVGVGGLQALMKSGMSVQGRRVAVLGSGPLILPVAALLSSSGAKLALVGEQAPFHRVASFALSLVGSPSLLAAATRYRLSFIGTRYRTGVWVVRASGNGRLEEVTVTNGVDQWTVPCDFLGVGFGLIPNLQLPGLLACEIKDGAVVVDRDQSTTVDRVFVAGEAAGVAGVDVAVAEGRIAGRAAAGARITASTAGRIRDRGRRHAVRMNEAFALRSELRSIATPECIVCRCEDVSIAAIEPGWTARQAKLYRRVGMGPCQGRICGAAMQFLRGWEPDSVRPPLQPSPVSTLAVERPPATLSVPSGAI